MPDKEGMKDAHNYHLDVPFRNETFTLKGSNSLDWGMKNRLSKTFDPASGRAVMLAFDHGYFMGPTTDLERIDVTILPLIKHADTLMLTRGILRSTIPPTFTKGIVVRASGGPSILKELSNEEIALDIEDAIRLNASAMAVQVFIGGEFETQSVANMTTLVDIGNRYGMPVLGVTAVGKDMARDAKYMRLASRICAELGASFVKTYYVDGFETVTASCPVPIVIAGGKKRPERDALEMAYNAVQQGASGVDMGRNIFQSESPSSMIQAVRKVVHENMRPADAYDLYLTLKGEKAAPAKRSARPAAKKKPAAKPVAKPRSRMVAKARPGARGKKAAGRTAKKTVRKAAKKTAKKAVKKIAGRKRTTRKKGTKRRAR
jgi:putative autoinducer-2 (AI-2) aldolase